MSFLSKFHVMVKKFQFSVLVPGDDDLKLQTGWICEENGKIILKESKEDEKISVDHIKTSWKKDCTSCFSECNQAGERAFWDLSTFKQMIAFFEVDEPKNELNSSCIKYKTSKSSANLLYFKMLPSEYVKLISKSNQMWILNKKPSFSKLKNKVDAYKPTPKINDLKIDSGDFSQLFTDEVFKKQIQMIIEELFEENILTSMEVEDDKEIETDDIKEEKTSMVGALIEKKCLKSIVINLQPNKLDPILRKRFMLYLKQLRGILEYIPLSVILELEQNIENDLPDNWNEYRKKFADMQKKCDFSEQHDDIVPSRNMIVESSHESSYEFNLMCCLCSFGRLVLFSLINEMNVNFMLKNLEDHVFEMNEDDLKWESSKITLASILQEEQHVSEDYQAQIFMDFCNSFLRCCSQNEKFCSFAEIEDQAAKNFEIFEKVQQLLDSFTTTKQTLLKDGKGSMASDLNDITIEFGSLLTMLKG